MLITPQVLSALHPDCNVYDSDNPIHIQVGHCFSKSSFRTLSSSFIFPPFTGVYFFLYSQKNIILTANGKINAPILTGFMPPTKEINPIIEIMKAIIVMIL